MTNVRLTRLLSILLAAAGIWGTAVPDSNLEVDRHIDRVRAKAGSPPDLRERERALAWLLDNAEMAFPAALRRAEANPADPVLVDLVGRFRRAEATPLLLRAFASDATRLAAASGLGMSPDPTAHAALRSAMSSSDRREVLPALSGAGAGEDARFCPDVRRHLTSEDAELRWMAVEVGTRLGCLTADELAALSANDPDQEVRSLAAAKLGPSRGQPE